MLGEALKDLYFDGGALEMGDGSEVAVKVREEQRFPLGRRRRYKVDLLYLLDGREVNVQVAADRVISHLQSEAVCDDVRIEADWLLLGHGAGVYLLDAIATSTNKRYRGMVNDFAVIDLDDYGVCIKPGMMENKVLSERMAFLRANYKPELQREFEGEVLRLLGVMLTLLDDMKFLRWTKRIRANASST
jgi:hypothetical protein